ncbi:MAG: PKD domain-containing protein, partial [Eudoraea sp.]|nr:PKD domain-containing protein [Eudoraea sp.]
DGGGLENTTTVLISVIFSGGNEPPVALAEATPLSGDAPLEVTFTGSNSTDDEAVVSYLWDFMDGGNTSTDADPIYTFATAGTYDVTLTVTDGLGLTDTDVITITVTDPMGNQPPVAVAEATPVSGDAPLEVTFTGSNSTDDAGVVSYLWDFMDGGSTSADPDPVYTFTSPGTYNVELTVTDAEGLEDTANITITVTSGGNLPPTAVALASPNSGAAPLAVIFNGENSYDDDAVVGYLWDFMDGMTSADMNPMYTFTADGTYNVQLTVTDSGGLTDTAIVTVVVGQSSNMPPTAVIDADLFAGPSPLDVNFSGRNSVDDFGVTSYAWDFGDGGTSTEVDPVHTYTEVGEYTVILTVTDAGGLVGTATVLIRVDPEAGNMKGLILENPAESGVAEVQVINKPSELIVMFIYLHDSTGRLVASHLAQDIMITGGTYQIPVGTLRDGLYFIGLVMNEGDPLLLKLLVKN